MLRNSRWAAQADDFGRFRLSARYADVPNSAVLKPGDIAPKGWLYLTDVVPDDEVHFGFPNISDNAVCVEKSTSGAHMTPFATERGSVIGPARLAGN